jgi:hypothetical protein
MPFHSLEKEKQNALDDFRGSARLVGAGPGYFLHDGWVHPHPAGSRGCGFLDSDHYRPKDSLIDCGDARMKTITMLGILLAVFGIFALVYQGVSYTRQEKVLDVGPIHATRDSTQHISFPPVFGGLALLGGAALLVIGAKQKA